MIVYADGQYAVIYECDEVQEDGFCVPCATFVAVVSRTTDQLSEEDMEKLEPIVEQLCFEKSDFSLIEHDGMYNRHHLAL